MMIQHSDNGKRGIFYVQEKDEVLAEMTYVWSADKIIIDHTEVNEALRGKNIGKQLVERSVAFAREKGIKILPLCPFARAVFDKTPSYSDVLF